MSCPAHALAVSRRFLDWEDVDLLRELCGRLPQRIRVVDLGAGSGTTAGSVFAERPFAHVWTFDIDQTALNLARAFIETLEPPVATRWHGMLMDSADDAVRAWPYQAGELDLVLIDSSHEYEHTAAELAAWLPMLRPGGLVWCHDYRGPYPGVSRAVDEAVERGEIELIAVRGLGWGGRKKDTEGSNEQ